METDPKLSVTMRSSQSIKQFSQETKGTCLFKNFLKKKQYKCGTCQLEICQFCYNFCKFNPKCQSKECLPEQIEQTQNTTTVVCRCKDDKHRFGGKELMIFISDTAKIISSLDNTKFCLFLELLNYEQIFKEISNGIIFDTKDPSDPVDVNILKGMVNFEFNSTTRIFFTMMISLYKAASQYLSLREDFYWFKSLTGQYLDDIFIYFNSNIDDKLISENELEYLIFCYEIFYLSILKRGLRNYERIDTQILFKFTPLKRDLLRQYNKDFIEEFKQKQNVQRDIIPIILEQLERFSRTDLYKSRLRDLKDDTILKTKIAYYEIKIYSMSLRSIKLGLEYGFFSDKQSKHLLGQISADCLLLKIIEKSLNKMSQQAQSNEREKENQSQVSKGQQNWYQQQQQQFNTKLIEVISKIMNELRHIRSYLASIVLQIIVLKLDYQIIRFLESYSITNQSVRNEQGNKKKQFWIFDRLRNFNLQSDLYQMRFLNDDELSKVANVTYFIISMQKLDKDCVSQVQDILKIIFASYDRFRRTILLIGESHFDFEQFLANSVGSTQLSDLLSLFVQNIYDTTLKLLDKNENLENVKISLKKLFEDLLSIIELKAKDKEQIIWQNYFAQQRVHLKILNALNSYKNFIDLPTLSVAYKSLIIIAQQNIDVQIGLLDSNFSMIIMDLLRIFPLATIDLLNRVFQNQSVLLQTTDHTLNQVANFYHEIYNDKTKDDKIEKYEILTGLADFIRLYINTNFYKTYRTLPENDLRVQEAFIKLLQDAFDEENFEQNIIGYSFTSNLFQRLSEVQLSKSKSNQELEDQKELRKAKANHLTSLLRMYNAATREREFPHTVFEIRCKFPFQKIRRLYSVAEGQDLLRLEILKFIQINCIQFQSNISEGTFDLLPELLPGMDDLEEIFKFMPVEISAILKKLAQKFSLSIETKRQFLINGVLVPMMKLIKFGLLNTTYYDSYIDNILQDLIKSKESILEISNDEPKALKEIVNLAQNIEKRGKMSDNEYFQEILRNIYEIYTTLTTDQDNFEEKYSLTRIQYKKDRIGDIVFQVIKLKQNLNKKSKKEQQKANSTEVPERSASDILRSKFRKYTQLALDQKRGVLKERESEETTQRILAKNEIVNLIQRQYTTLKRLQPDAEDNNFKKIPQLLNQLGISNFEKILLIFMFDIFRDVEEQMYSSHIFEMFRIFNGLIYWDTETAQNLLLDLLENDETQKRFFEILKQQLEFTLNSVLIRNYRDKIWRQSYDRALLILQLIQNCCEENNIKLKQQFAHLQILTVLFREIQVSRYERVTTKAFLERQELLPLTGQIFLVLTELATGPSPENQKSILQIDFEMIDAILKTNTSDIESEHYILKENVLDYLHACCEDSPLEIIEHISRNLDPSTLYKEMYNCFKQLYDWLLRNKNKVKKENKQGVVGILNYIQNKLDDFRQTYSQEEKYKIKFTMKNYKSLENFFYQHNDFAEHRLIRTSYKLFQLLYIIAKKNLNYAHFLQKKRDEAQKVKEAGGLPEAKKLKTSEDQIVVFHLLSNLSRSIEVQTANEQLVQIFFLKLPLYKLLSRQTKNKFLENCDRDTSESKLTNLLEEVDTFEAEMKHNYRVYIDRLRLFRLLGKGDLKTFERVALILCLIINLIIFDDQTQSHQILLSIKTEKFGIFIAFLQIIYCLLYLVIGISLKFSLLLQITRKEYLQSRIGEGEINWLDNICIFLYTILRHQQSKVFMIHIICSLLGLFVTKGFFAVELLTIVNLSKVFKQLVEAIASKAEQIIFSGLIAAIVLYTYAMFGYLFFNDQFEDKEVYTGTSDIKQPLCDTFRHCFFTIFNYGLRSGGGVGELMKPPEYNPYKIHIYYSRLVYDLTFYILVNVIFINIIFGVIIDTFADLRDRNTKIEFDSENVCFICDLKKWDFLKNGLSFKEHTTKKHNLWNYVYFIAHLKNTNPKEMSGLESYVYKKLSNGDLTWLPIQKSLSLQEKKARKLVNAEDVLDASFRFNLSQGGTIYG